MPTRVIQNSFAGGELSPALYGRHDIEAYFKGAAKIENFVVQKTGGVKKRGGIVQGHSFATVTHTGNDGEDIALIPYRFDRKDGGVLVVTSGMTGTARWNRVFYLPKNSEGSFVPPDAGIPDVYLTQGYYIHPPSLSWEQIGDTLLLSGENGPETPGGTAPSPSLVSSVMVNHLSQTFTVSNYAPSAQPATPYYLGYSTQGDDMIVSSTSSRARTLYYAVCAENGGVRSELKKLTVANTNAEWPAANSITVTAKIHPAADGTYPEEIVFAKRSGALYGELARLQAGDFTAEGTDGALPYRSYIFTDENHLSGTPLYKQTALVTDPAGVSARCVMLYQQRLIFGGLPGEPFSLLCSGLGDFRSFHADRPVSDTDPFRFTIATDSPATIRYSAPYRESILLFCDTGVWRVSGSANEGFSARTCQVFQIADIGCSPRIKPVKTTDGVVYVGADNRTVYELRYDLARDTVTPSERSVLSDHLTEGREILSMTHQRYPASVIWFTLDDGTFLSLSYQPEHELYAWARHAAMPDTLTGTPVRACCPGTVSGDHSDVALLCASSAWALSYDPPASGSCYMLASLNPAVNSDGDEPVRAELVTLRPELPDRNVQGMQKNVIDCLIRVRDTRRLSAGPEGDADPAQVVAAADDEEAYTGNVKIMPRGAVNEDGRMSIVSAAGPCEIQCVVFKTEIHQ